MPNVRRNTYNGRRNNTVNQKNYENINKNFVKESKSGNEKAWKEKQQNVTLDKRESEPSTEHSSLA